MLSDDFWQEEWKNSGAYYVLAVYCHQFLWRMLAWNTLEAPLLLKMLLKTMGGNLIVYEVVACRLLIPVKPMLRL